MKYLMLSYVAQVLGYDASSLRHAAIKGTLKATKLGDRPFDPWVTTIPWVERWLSNKDAHKYAPEQYRKALDSFHGLE